LALLAARLSVTTATASRGSVVWVGATVVDGRVEVVEVDEVVVEAAVTFVVLPAPPSVAQPASSSKTRRTRNPGPPLSAF